MVEHTTENCGVTSPILVLGTRHSRKGVFFYPGRWGIIGGMQKKVSHLIQDKKTVITVLLLVLLVAAVIIFSVLKGEGKTTAPVNAVSTEHAFTSTPRLAYFSTSTIEPPTSATAAVIATATLAPTVLPTITPLPTSIPDSTYLKISANPKFFYLGCEAAAAVDLAGYYGVLLYQYDFQHALPISDNPDLGFVGDANGPWGQVPPYAYGVHAAPVAALLQKYGVDAEGGKGYTLEQIKEKIAAGHPVIVWVIGNMVGGVPAEYTDSKGNTTIVAAYEHVAILTGYDSDSVRYVNNGNVFEVPNEVFLNSWGVLGNMAVFHR